LLHPVRPPCPLPQYAFRASTQGNTGITWGRLSDPNNGLPAVMIIFAVETAVFMALAWYLEQVVGTGVGVRRHPLFFLGRFRRDKRAKGGKGAGGSNGTFKVNSPQSRQIHCA
jgi:hypothetical protein